MIKVNNLNKHFNKGKSNEIHVINNTTLEFPTKGLVSLVGQSGSGKTTLLNVISGLDSVKGKIEFGDKVINKYKSSAWDEIRAHDIGYVFQNYHLLEDRSIYDNIKLTLNMIGIIDEEEVEYRIHYVLDAVGMYRFRRKKANDLSGGQKQRVAIARAIAKNPKVIIADEPTGNLDSKNSLDVMNIIKEIALERLVILVTHDTNLAYKYSDRIISLTDGVVKSNEENIHSKDTEISFDDQNIYLGNLNKHSKDENIEVYSNSDTNDIKLKVIKINNNYYLETNDSNVRFNIVTPKSGITIIDDKKENFCKNKPFTTEFSLDELEKIQSKRVHKRTLSFKDSVIEAFRKITNLGRKSKIQVVALILLGVMFSSSIHALFSSLVFDESKIYNDDNIYEVDYNTRVPSELNDSLFTNDNLIPYFGDKEYDGFFAISSNYRNNYLEVENMIPLDALTKEDIVLGRFPENPYEVVIDQTVLDSKYNKSFNFNLLGIYSPKHLIGQKIIKSPHEDFELEIVGTVNNGNKGFYIDHYLLTSLSANFYMAGENIFDEETGDIIDYKLQKDINLRKLTNDTILVDGGRLPNSDFVDNAVEVLLGLSFKDKYELNSNHYISSSTSRNTYEVVIVGYYEDEVIDSKMKDNMLPIIAHPNFYNILLKETNEYRGGGLTFYAINKLDKTPEQLINLRENTINQIKSQQKGVISSSIVQMTIALVVSGLIFYFLVRSSLTSRIKEISILRSLGVSKSEVVTLYSLEYFIMTAFTSLIGVIIGSIFISSISTSFLGEILPLRTTPLSILVAVVFIFITNILIALIPVMGLLRKTPAQMLTSYDI